MGWQFRKSIGVGPFRVNLSKSGIGYSVGAGGFRTGKSASGRKYSTFSIPGTGFSYKKSGQDASLGNVVGGALGSVTGGRKGCALAILLPAAAIVALAYTVVRAWEFLS